MVREQCRTGLKLGNRGKQRQEIAKARTLLGTGKSPNMDVNRISWCFQKSSLEGTNSAERNNLFGLLCFSCPECRRDDWSSSGHLTVVS